MPNWCTGAITFYSKDKDELQKFKTKIEEIYDGQPTHENGFGHGWLGDYANTFYPETGWEKISCRGAIEIDDDMICQEKDYFYFKVWFESAWDAKIGLWHHVVSEFFPKIKIAYIAEECGCDYFVKWDETGLFYPEETYVDIYYPTKGGEEDYIDDHYGWNITSLTKWLDENMPFTFEHKPTLEELDEEINTKLELLDIDGQDFFCQFANYAEIPPEDFYWID